MALGVSTEDGARGRPFGAIKARSRLATIGKTSHVLQGLHDAWRNQSCLRLPSVDQSHPKMPRGNAMVGSEREGLPMRWRWAESTGTCDEAGFASRAAPVDEGSSG